MTTPRPKFRPFYVLSLIVLSAIGSVLLGSALTHAQSLPSTPTLMAIRDPNYGAVCYYLSSPPYPGQISCVKVTQLSVTLP